MKVGLTDFNLLFKYLVDPTSARGITLGNWDFLQKYSFVVLRYLKAKPKKFERPNAA